MMRLCSAEPLECVLGTSRCLNCKSSSPVCCFHGAASDHSDLGLNVAGVRCGLYVRTFCSRNLIQGLMSSRKNMSVMLHNRGQIVDILPYCRALTLANCVVAQSLCCCSII